MTTKQQTPPPDETGDPVAALLRSAGPRVAPDPERMQRAMGAVHAEWQNAVSRRRRAQWHRLAAAAAAIGLGVWLVTVLRPQAPVPVATVARVAGDALLRYAADDGVSTNALLSGHVMRTGEEVDTGATGRALLVWPSGIRLRVDRNSLLRLTSTIDVELDRGAVYVEAGGEGSKEKDAAQLSVSTPFGTVRHVGTRFEVRVAEGSARVRVRDGLASFSGQGHAAVPVRAGQQLSVSMKGLRLEPGPGAADPAWGWVREIAPAFTLEGRSLFDTLEWLSQESGLRVVYRGEQARTQARTVVLRGSIEGLETRQALLAVLAGSGLAFDLQSDHVAIRVNEPH